MHPRLAAGVGVVSAFLLLGGSGAAVALADGPRGSDRGDNSGRGDSSSRDGAYDRDRSSVDRTGGGFERGPSMNDGPDSGRRGFTEGNARRGDAGMSGREAAGSPPVRVGSGREDIAQLAPDDSSAPVRRGGGGSGSARTSHPDTAFEPPRVSFGNGRTPEFHGGAPEPVWQAPAPAPVAPAPPPPPPPAPPASWTDRVATPPPVVRQFVVAPAAEWTDPLWGVAGLLLIPAAGAALGYRQARASQAAERLRRH